MTAPASYRAENISAGFRTFFFSTAQLLNRALTKWLANSP
jgi:hypothetical protein